MFKHDWKWLLKNRPLLVATIVMMFIPIMYGGIILGSFWDPFGKTENLPVAVVNEDVPAEVNGEQMTIGKDLIDELKNNKDFEWHFVSEKQGEEGFDDNEYYMVINIPKDFSANAATALDQNPKKMQINYKINPGRNFFIENISNNAMTKINEKISATISENYVEAIFDNIQTLGDGFADAADGAGKLEDGIGQVKDGNQQITENLSKLASSSLLFTDGANKLEVGLGKFFEGVEKVNTGALALKDGVQNYTNGAALLASGAKQLNEKNNDLANGMASSVDGSKSLNANLGKVQEQGSAPLSEGLQTLQTEAVKLTDENQGVPALAVGQQALHAGLNDALAGSTALNAGLSTIQGKLPQTETVNQLTTGLSGIQQLSEGIQAALAKGDTTTATILSEQLARTTQAVIPGSVQALNGYNEISTALSKQLIPGSTALNSGLTEAVKGSNALVAATNNLNTNIPKLVEGINNAALGTQKLDGSLVQLVDGSSRLAQGSLLLQKGITDYTNGVATLNQGANHLTGNSGLLVDGVNQLASGTSQLTENIPALADGSSQISSGAVQISDGAGKLAEGSTKLGDGISKVEDGTGELKEKLTEGAEKVEVNEAGDENYQMIASPTNVKAEKTTDVPNYGHALSPNFLSLALYIGALAFNLVFPIGVAAIPPRSGREWWFSKFSLGAFQAIMGALFLDIFAVKGLGLEVDHMGLFVLISILASLTYMFMIMMLGIGLGNPGRLLAMILLVFQLASSGAMFPRELTSSFFDAINPYMPMTYVIYGFREAISSAEGLSLYTMSAAILGACIIVFNIILLFVFKWKKGKDLDILTTDNKVVA